MYRALRLSAGLRLLINAWDRGVLSEGALCAWLDSFYGGAS